MNKIAIRVPTTRFIVSMQGRPSKIREKRQAHMAHIEMCSYYDIPNSWNGSDISREYTRAQDELWD